jgi:hypothetical protein
MQPTKFDQLWNLLCDVEEKRKNYRHPLSTFLPQFLNGLISSFNWSAHLVEVGASEESFFEYNTAIYSLTDYAVLLSNDASWQFWVRFTLSRSSPSETAPKPVKMIVSFVFTPSGKGFYVVVATLKSEPKTFKIESMDSEEFIALGDFVYAAMDREIQSQLGEKPNREELRQIVL